MSTFETTRGLYSQEHFTVVELTIPVVNGTCTIGGQPGYGTPLSCDQESNGFKTYKFTTANSPQLNGNGDIIYRCIASISETPTKLQSGRGLASRGSVSIQLIDFDNADPTPLAPAVTDDIIKTGTFFGKLDARNILANKELVIKNYRVEADGSIDLVNGAEARHYVVDSLVNTGGGKWSITGKDELAKLNLDNAVFPENLGGYLRQDIDSAARDIPVDPNVTYKAGDIVLIGSEFMSVTSVSGIGTSSASLSVSTRGNDIKKNNITLTKTETDNHSAGDEVFVCRYADNRTIDYVLADILYSIGVPILSMDIQGWIAEIEVWHPTTRINTIWYEEESAGAVLERLLTDYMIDLWFDPVERLIKISAVSVWKQSGVQLFEDDQIDFGTIRKKPEESLRATSALVVYDKRYLATSDSVENYKKASVFSITKMETAAFYGEPKRKTFEYSVLLDKNGADLLVQRFVARYSSPVSYSWKTQERKLTFKVGDIVDLNTSATVDFSGAMSSTTRAQVTSIKPNYTQYGRDYTVTALAYAAVFETGEEIILDTVNDLNLYRLAGNPPSAVEITFVIDGANGSSSINTPSITVGDFPSGSKVIIILANGTKLQANGGNGGKGDVWGYEGELGQYLLRLAATNGKAGGTVINCSGVDCDIYLSGATPSTNYPNANGYIFAPNGGDGGYSSNPNSGDTTPSNGGNGGHGNIIGIGGAGGITEKGFDVKTGEVGDNGSETETYLNLGKPGRNNNATGGAAGSGIIKGGGTVNLYGSTPQRYVNGNGDF